MKTTADPTGADSARPATRPFREIPGFTPRRGSLTRLFYLDRVAALRALTEGGDLYRTRLLDKEIVVVTGPALLHELMVDRAFDMRRDALMRHVIYPLLGEGLITSDGELWRRQRKLMAPLFTPSQLSRYADDIVTCADRQVARWSDGASLDVLHETVGVTMAVAGKILFGVDMFDETDELGAALKTGLAWTGERLQSVLPLAQLAVRRGLMRLTPHVPASGAAMWERLVARLERPMILPIARDRAMSEAVATLDRRVQRMVDERRAEESGRRDLLGRLLAARDDESAGMSDKQLRDEIVTLFVAGHDTTASTLAWALDLLVRHPEAYRAAREQVDALDGPPKHEDLARLGVLVRVFKEALRIYPPIPMMAREAVRDFELGGFTIPEGTTLLLCPWATQHRADLWPDPERFDPSRFTPDAEAARPRYALLSFSGGPRVCLGMHLALMEGPLVLAAMLRRADFELLDPSPVAIDVREALRPKGMRLRVRLR